MGWFDNLKSSGWLGSEAQLFQQAEAQKQAESIRQYPNFYPPDIHEKIQNKPADADQQAAMKRRLTNPPVQEAGE